MARKPIVWHPENIKAELRKQFGSLCHLSESWGLHRTAISNTLHRPMDSKQTEKRIAKALGVPLHVLWPDRWSEEGTPLPRSPVSKHSRGVVPVERQKRAA